MLSHIPRFVLGVASFALALSLLPAPAAAQFLPPRFESTTIASGLQFTTSLAELPDGRILLSLQFGQVRMIRNDALLPEPVHTFTVETTGERGLLGLAVDPAFTENGFVYAYHITPSPQRKKLSRFTIAPGTDIAVPGSVVELKDLGDAVQPFHHGGAIHFGPDGKLYIALGDHTFSANSQSLTSLFGKILRFNADASIPSDNPFFNSTTGDNRAIWALGLRNPFTFAFERGTGRMHINDVGQVDWEEINVGLAGRNYGWPATEGQFDPAMFPQFTNPILAYHHTNPGQVGFTGFAITGAAFYNPPVQNFPDSYMSDYFFGDVIGDWIRSLDNSTGLSTLFASGVDGVVDLDVDQHGRLLVLRRAAVLRIAYDCPADFDLSGTIDVPDIFAFLSSWFASDPRADIDGIPGIQVPDIFAFLSSWFSSCAA